MQFAKLLGIGAIALSVSGVALAQTSTPAPTAPSTNRSDPANPSTTAPSGTSTTSPSGGMAAPADRSGSTGSTMSSGSGASSANALPSAFSRMSANDLVGKSVYNAAGERIGEIDDIVVGKSASNAPEAVIGVGGFLGIGEKKAAIPLNSLSMQGDRIVASSLTKEQVQSMSNYNASDYDKYDRNKTLGDAR
jgi:sporulation protein YlmC with PRC-barrel domain